MLRQSVDIDVVEGGPVVLLRELIAQVLEIGDVLQRAGAVAEPHAVLSAKALRSVPVLIGTRLLQVSIELVEPAE